MLYDGDYDDDDYMSFQMVTNYVTLNDLQPM